MDSKAAEEKAPAPAPTKRKAPQKQKQRKAPQKKKQQKQKASRLGMEAKKAEDFPNWYKQVITRADMITYYPEVKGCYILRPWSYEIWEAIQDYMNGEIKRMGVKNAYFPIFVTSKLLTKEEDHIAGFAAEVAWVTRAGNTELEEPLAIRPTSETIMYQAYSKWIRSHRDLPLKLNQWTNVVRWEFDNPTPFIRSREFLWQEGHTAFATLEEADKEVMDILDLYARVFEDLLAVPVIKGRKTDKEKFAGGRFTTTVETFIAATGRGLQGATSHSLGQNFAKMFNIEFENEAGKKALVWQNSWGLSTRVLGAMVMVHGDDRGLVLPPRVAPIQVVLVPIVMAKQKERTQVDKVKEFGESLKNAGVRVEVDDRLNLTCGWKFNHWELKGVPLRVEIGPRDMKQEVAVLVRRDMEGRDAKKVVPFADVEKAVVATLAEMQADMLNRAREDFASHLVRAVNWDEFLHVLSGGNVVLSPWCGELECEEAIKFKSGEAARAQVEDGGEGLSSAAKSLCIPFDQPPIEEGTCCVGVDCGKAAKQWCMFGRSY